MKRLRRCALKRVLALRTLEPGACANVVATLLRVVQARGDAPVAPSADADAAEEFGFGVDEHAETGAAGSSVQCAHKSVTRSPCLGAALSPAHQYCVRHTCEAPGCTSHKKSAERCCDTHSGHVNAGSVYIGYVDDPEALGALVVC